MTVREKVQCAAYGCKTRTSNEKGYCKKHRPSENVEADVLNEHDAFVQHMTEHGREALEQGHSLGVVHGMRLALLAFKHSHWSQQALSEKRQHCARTFAESLQSILLSYYTDDIGSAEVPLDGILNDLRFYTDGPYSQAVSDKADKRARDAEREEKVIRRRARKAR